MQLMTSCYYCKKDFGFYYRVETGEHRWACPKCWREQPKGHYAFFFVWRQMDGGYCVERVVLGKCYVAESIKDAKQQATANSYFILQKNYPEY